MLDPSYAGPQLCGQGILQDKITEFATCHPPILVWQRRMLKWIFETGGSNIAKSAVGFSMTKEFQTPSLPIVAMNKSWPLSPRLSPVLNIPRKSPRASHPHLPTDPWAPPAPHPASFAKCFPKRSLNDHKLQELWHMILRTTVITLFMGTKPTLTSRGHITRHPSHAAPR